MEVELGRPETIHQEHSILPRIQGACIVLLGALMSRPDGFMEVMDILINIPIERLTKDAHNSPGKCHPWLLRNASPSRVVGQHNLDFS